VPEQTIEAHRERRLQTLALSFDGKLLASCTVNGKRIKIFNTETRELLRTVRRGFKKQTIN